MKKRILSMIFLIISMAFTLALIIRKAYYLVVNITNLSKYDDFWLHNATISLVVQHSIFLIFSVFILFTLIYVFVSIYKNDATLTKELISEHVAKWKANAQKKAEEKAEKKLKKAQRDLENIKNQTTAK